MDSFVNIISVAAFFGLIGSWILAKNFGTIAGSTDEDGDEQRADQEARNSPARPRRSQIAFRYHLILGLLLLNACTY